MPYYIKIYNTKYNNQFSPFYDQAVCNDLIEQLNRNFPVIYAEWVAFNAYQKKKKKPFFLYSENGWTTIMLYSYGLRYHKNCFYFPNTLTVLNSNNAVVTAYFSTLAPGTKLKAHYGDTDATYRIHLGLEVPAGLPNCGIEVGGIQKAWHKNQTLIFNDAHFHTAWNLSDENRTVLIIDVIRPEYIIHKGIILAKVLGTLGMGRILYPLKLIDKIPHCFLLILHKIATLIFMVILPIQRSLRLFYSKP